MEEIAATNEEVDELVATRLLRMVRHRGCWFDREGTMHPGDWSPTRDASTALRVLARFQRKGWVVALYDGEKSQVVLTKDERVYRGEDELPGRAACQAMLASIGLRIVHKVDSKNDCVTDDTKIP